MDTRHLFLLVAFSTAVVGCDASINRSEHQARLEVADYAGWMRAKADSYDDTIREVWVVKAGRLGRGDETSIPLDVTGAHRALVIAACDQQCSDLDLRVVTADGRLIGLDQ